MAKFARVGVTALLNTARTAYPGLAILVQCNKLTCLIEGIPLDVKTL